MKSDNAAWILGAVGLGTGLALALAFKPLPASHHSPTAVAQGGPVLRAPRVTTPIAIDGEVLEPTWRDGLGSTGVFPSVDGRPMNDSSAQIAWDETNLYVLLYAADANITATIKTPDAPLWTEDSFRLAFNVPGESRARVLSVSPLGTLSDAYESGGATDPSWQSGVRLAHDADGTLNFPGDDDEEWIIEMAIPLASLGVTGGVGERIGFSVRRCDAPRGEAKRCGAWGEPEGQIVLDR